MIVSHGVRLFARSTVRARSGEIPARSGISRERRASAPGLGLGDWCGEDRPQRIVSGDHVRLRATALRRAPGEIRPTATRDAGMPLLRQP
ncbi:hypothetical protein MOTC310_18685 [Methylobacterium oryzae]|uniref:Uncharacterized protein n=1 Tax=Methylobacterium oryzae TaxID=334852 RepID=A0ABU7TSV7_9HYPH